MKTDKKGWLYQVPGTLVYLRNVGTQSSYYVYLEWGSPERFNSFGKHFIEQEHT